jgi:hypothetical protein
MDETNEAVVDFLVGLFMPEQAMSLEDSEDLGRKVHSGTRAYCYTHFPGWTSNQVTELADVVRKRIEWKLMAKRRGLTLGVTAR